jgi:hypothetical protein
MKIKKMKQVSKEEFLKVYNAHSPNLFLPIMFKHFSTHMKKSLGTKIIVALFVVFTIPTIIFQERNNMIARNISMIFAYVPFALWGVSALVAFKWNQFRTKRIQKILGLTFEEYNYYATLYVTE